MKKYIILATVITVVIFCMPCTGSATTPQEFYTLAQQQRGINAFAATVQSAHETGFWTSYLWREAFNGAGLKAPLAWRSAGKPHILVSSPESDGKNYTMRESYFRRYSSAQEFLRDYANKIVQDYPVCAANIDNFWCYFAGLYRGRWGPWATDHKYFEKLVGMAVRFAPEIFGAQWVRKLETSYCLALQRGALEPWQQKIIINYLKGVGVNVEILGN